MTNETAKCEICGEPMPAGEEMFKFHGYSGNCPKPPLPRPADVDLYEQGRRDVLNAILALNPKLAQKLHVLAGGTDDTFTNHDGRLPFDVVFWVTEVAAQLGIEPKDDARSQHPLPMWSEEGR
ncbi:MAG: hypothetical protein EOS58_30640 [Mesorhizobium sp.]|nr:MAG: hypothetical protein EOS58_30640 [Mesorhizobium sp.]TIW26552.1 MAG: hypothetical protein E5V63_13335 [Mesorhizobium sp.]